jgi:hypothetical protein
MKCKTFKIKPILIGLISLSYSGLLFADTMAAPKPTEVSKPEKKFDVKFNGFFSAVGGRIFNSGLVQPLGATSFTTPAYIADWNNAGVYSRTFSLNPESRLGLQSDIVFTPDLSITGQAVVRGASLGPNIQWLYGTYKFNDHFKFQVGRKRIPFYFYSEFQDVGIAYPWITPPAELYGWAATNYNGANLNYSTSVNTLSSTDTTSVNWKNLRGGDFTLSKGVFTTRLVYLKTDPVTYDKDTDASTRTHQRSYGIAMNLNFEKLSILTEVTELDSNYYENFYKVYAPASSFGIGYQIGKWTPFVNYARYWERTDQPDLYTPSKFDRYSFTMRYDINANSAIKMQVDRSQDHTLNFTGYNTIGRISYDMVF